MVVAIRLIQLLLAVAILGPSAYTHLCNPDRGRPRDRRRQHLACLRAHLLAPRVQLLGRPLLRPLPVPLRANITTFSLGATWTGLIFAADTVRRSLRSSYGFCDNYKVFGGVVAGIARLGAIEFLLFFIAWVTDAVVSYRHRRGGGRARARRVAAAGSGTAPYQLQMQRRTFYPKAQHWAPAYGQHLRPDACASSSRGLSRARASSSPACGSLPPDLLS
ncbi:uncharacterized protein G6M90_00g058560 [Metarhizium brunneum]|uniref:MARVEL domain-containing protein n=1 Tax=Metarhizium brunneum TaxID=500148 RepID=A0A7D5UWM3_9HYPO|nr:hypothetical protein G6M90_00g058560 [Metarhizium brunneum]